MLSGYNKRIFWILVGFLIPVILTLIINVGIILQLPNYPHIGESVTNYLFEPATDTSVVDILAGLSTILIVFFAFLQLAYSIRHVPASFVTGYILFDKITLIFISSFISI